MNRYLSWLLFTAAPFAVSLVGCQRPPAQMPPQPPPPVSISYPVEKTVVDYSDFAGQTAAVGVVEVRARVWGYLEKLDFKEGMIVKKGDVLFEIDPRTYQAAVDQSKAKTAQDKAQLRHVEATYRRVGELRGKGAMSQEDIDKAQADRDAALATLAADQADLEQKQLDLEFTKVRAPIDGRVSRAEVTEGNIVQSGQSNGTLLTTIVSVDPIYVYFDVDERTVLQIRRLIREGVMKSARETTVPIFMGLTDEEGFPHRGIVNFVDNRIDASSGTLRVRGVFSNADGLLTPGLFVRVRLPIGMPHRSILVAEQALGSDQGQKFVYVVDGKDEVAYRAVKLGRVHDGLRVIETGIKKTDKVLVTGLQRARPGMKVQPKLIPMPSRSTASAETASSTTGPAAK